MRDGTEIDGTVSRRNALKGGAVLLGGGFLATSWMWPARAVVRRRTVFKLDPKADEGSCRACKRHGANKLYATRAAVKRAHRRCNCTIVTRTLPLAKWKKLFGTPGDLDRKAVDKRWPWVKRILNA